MNKNRILYFDNASSTPADPAVLAAMIPYFAEEFGNPASPHAMGREAESAVETAGEQAARLIGTDSSHIIFFHSATEANRQIMNWGIPAIMATPEEHSSVLRFSGTPRDGWDSRIVTADPAEIEARVKDAGPGGYFGWMASVQLVNNETGAVNDVKHLAQVLHRAGALLHTDATAAAGAMQVDAEALGCDFMTFSSHKMYGPKGAAALYVKNPDWADLVQYGGTVNVPALVGFGKACETARAVLERNGRDNDYERLAYVFLAELETILGTDGFAVNIHEDRAWFKKILNIRFDGVDAETLVYLCSDNGLMISAGAACESHEQKPSHVLKAMGLSDEQARSSVRVSFSRYTTVKDAECGAEILADCVKRLRLAGGNA